MTTKILENVHSLSIIKEVEKWPVLYSRNSAERGNLYFKTKVWHEVAKSVFDDWDTCSEAEKDSRVNDLAKRWRNLRDTFKRQVEIEKKVKEGYESKKKTYVYFKHMLFLLPHMTAENEELNEFFEKKKGSKKKAKKIEQHFIEESEPPRARKTDVDEIDEDRHFALSLIPTLKKMSDDDKLIAKMEILKVLRNAGRKRRKRDDGPGRRRREEIEEIAPVKMEFINTEEEMEEVVEYDSVDDSD